jgi:hypothetical protein
VLVLATAPSDDEYVSVDEYEYEYVSVDEYEYEYVYVYEYEYVYVYGYGGERRGVNMRLPRRLSGVVA